MDSQLEDLYDVYGDTLKKIEVEKNNIWELENHTKKLEKEIDSLRKNQVPDSCYKETIAKAQKDVIKLENRLDVVNKKCSNVLTENSHLRDEINHMLQDRFVFVGFFMLSQNLEKSFFSEPTSMKCGSLWLLSSTKAKST